MPCFRLLAAALVAPTVLMSGCATTEFRLEPAVEAESPDAAPAAVPMVAQLLPGCEAMSIAVVVARPGGRRTLANLEKFGAEGFRYCRTAGGRAGADVVRYRAAAEDEFLAGAWEIEFAQLVRYIDPQCSQAAAGMDWRSREEDGSAGQFIQSSADTFRKIAAANRWERVHADADVLGAVLGAAGRDAMRMMHELEAAHAESPESYRRVLRSTISWFNERTEQILEAAAGARASPSVASADEFRREAEHVLRVLHGELLVRSFKTNERTLQGEWNE